MIKDAWLMPQGQETLMNVKLTPHSEILLREYLARGGCHTP